MKTELLLKAKKLEEIQGGRMVESICPPGLDSKGDGAEKGGMARNEEQGSGKGEDGEWRSVGGARFGKRVKRISCLCLNARSIMDKMDEFMALMDVLRPDVWGLPNRGRRRRLMRRSLVLAAMCAVQKG